MRARFKCVKKGCVRSFPSLNSGKFSSKNYVHPSTFTLSTNERLTCNVILSCFTALPQGNYHRLRQRHQWAHQQWASLPGYWFGCSPLTPGFHLCLLSGKKGPPFFFEVIAYLKIFVIFCLLSITLLWSSRLLQIKMRPDFNIGQKSNQNLRGYIWYIW